MTAAAFHVYRSDYRCLPHNLVKYFSWEFGLVNGQNRRAVDIMNSGNNSRIVKQILWGASLGDESLFPDG